MNEKYFYYLINWYYDNCNGDWEHSTHFEVKDIENRQLFLYLNVEDTELEGRHFDDVKTESFDCEFKNNRFKVKGSVKGIFDMLKVFFDWAQYSSPTDTELFKNANIEWLFKWYSTFSEDNSIKFGIGNIDNPGWHIKIDLSSTQYSERVPENVSMERTEQDWIAVNFEKGIIRLFGGPFNLYEMVDAFREWLEGDWEAKKKFFEKEHKPEEGVDRKVEIGEGLRKQLDLGYDIERIAKWAHDYYSEHYDNLLKEDEGVLANIYSMVYPGQEYFKSKETLEYLADILIQGEKQPLTKLQELALAEINQPQHKALKREIGEGLKKEIEKGYDPKRITDWAINFRASHNENITREIESIFRIIREKNIGRFELTKDMLEKVAEMLINGEEELFPKVYEMIRKEYENEMY